MDRDAPEVAKKLRAAGATVRHIGDPLDLLVGLDGVTMLVEVKQPPGPKGGTSDHGQKLTENQVEFIDRWRGAPPLVVTVLDCVAKVRAEAARVRSLGARANQGGEPC